MRPRLPSGEGFDGDAPDDPLPSWAEGHAKAAIVAFVDRVTRDGGADFVPPPERIAAFDNDGTLWSEQPYYFQLAFTVDRVQALTKNHPEWRQKPVLRALIGGDKAALAGIGEKDILEVVALTHAGVTVDEFTKEVAAWTASARHPRFDRPYTELIFQPMLELLTYLRANGFKTFIVSGGGVDFMRPWAPAVYGVPPEQIVGSSIKASFTLNGDKVSIEKLPQIEFVDDGPGKPVAINRFIGRKPIFAAGNSDGDLEMLQWTTLNPGPRFGLIVRHTDAEREWAYDRGSKIGRLDKALDEAPARGWLVVDMKEDWKRVYPDRKQ
nr:HAD family hydrolase [Methylocella silvestris]